MTIFFLPIFGVYYLLTFFLIYGLKKAVKKDETDKTLIPFADITVVVAFKNEESDLVTLIQSLSSQHYPKEKFEVILVDDHSNDNSVLVIMEAIKGLLNFKLISTGWGDSGKKKAITNGVLEAKNNIIVTTDADCVVPPTWLKRINEAFHLHDPTLVFGGVRIKDSKGFFSALQVMEFSSLIASGAATYRLGAPSMCNAANLAFSKWYFDSVKGYEGNFEIASGDDEFLMRKMLARYPNSVLFMNDQDAIVSTKPQPTISQFINQRLRWAAKLPHNPSWSTRILGWYIILFQATYLLLIGLSFTKLIPLSTSLFLIGIKWLLEFIFLRNAMAFLQSKWNFRSFFSLQILYPIYVVYVGVISNFVTFEWKGKRYKA